MTPELTPAQARVLNFIRLHMVANGYPPTHAEIAKALGYQSPNAAKDHLKALQHRGFIQLMPNTARGIRLTSMPTEQISMMDVLADTVQPFSRPVLSIRKI